MSERAARASDALIVGGGVVGAATAFFLARAGLTVTIVERRAGLGQVTTAASAASFRAQFTDAANIALMRESIGVFERFGDVTGQPDYDLGLRQQGYLFVSDRDADVAPLRARVARQQALGLPDVEFLAGDEVRRRFPYLAPSVRAAAYRARDGWLDAGALTHGFARAADARLQLDTTVERLAVTGGRVTGVVTNRGTLPAALVVLAAGPFSGALAATAGVTLPLTLLRRHKLLIAPRPAIPPTAPMTIDAVTGAHWRPHGAGGALAAWSRPEPPAPPLDPVPVDPNFAATTLQALGRLTPFWRTLAPILRLDDLAVSAGQYTVTPDHNPLIGPLAAIAGLYVNTGYSGHGVMASPGGARLLADLVTGRPTHAENPYDPTRFASGAPVADVGERMVL